MKNNFEVFRFIVDTNEGKQTNIERKNAMLQALRTEGADLIYQ